MAESGKWYVHHTYSGYENKVKTSIETLIELRKLQDLIFDLRIPTETVTEERENGKKVEVERKIFPGYVLINMIVNDDTWILIRNIRGVTGFVGPEGKPVPLTEKEIQNLGIKKLQTSVEYAVGDTVKITSGSLENFTGVVTEIDIPANKVTVMISMFGRETPAEIELNQVALI